MPVSNQQHFTALLDSIIYFSQRITALIRKVMMMPVRDMTMF